MNGKKTKELRRIAQEIAAREGIKNGLVYKHHGPFTKKIDALDNRTRLIFDEVEGKRVKRTFEVTGYTRENMGVRGIYLALKHAYYEAIRRGDNRPLRELFAEDLQKPEPTPPATKTRDMPRATTPEDIERAVALINEMKEAA